VRGVVRSAGPDAAPVAGATASVQQCVPAARAEQRKGTATTGADGEYEIGCWFGGMCLLFWCPGVGVPDTAVDFAAPGHRSRTVRLLGREPEAGVSRPSCEAPPHLNCHGLDVTLEPEPALSVTAP
jgi:hypothetical protein